MYNEDQKIVFLFSPELDNTFLQELYSEDLQQAEMVFESSIQQLHNEQQLAEARFYDGDIAELKKIIHKMKPLFGYIGMTKTMEDFTAFEQTCAGFETAAEVENAFQHIKAVTREAVKKAEKEIKRLKQHNTQYL